MGGDARLNRDAGVLDLVITNVTVIDAVQGVIKADVGIRDGRIVGIGKSGNPSMMNGVDPDLIVGNSTDAITGEELGTFQDAYTAVLRGCQSQVVIAELVKPEK